MIEHKNAIADAVLGTGGALAPFWWPNSLEGWLQCVLAVAGIVLVCVRIWRAVKKGYEE